MKPANPKEAQTTAVLLGLCALVAVFAVWRVSAAMPKAPDPAPSSTPIAGSVSLSGANPVAVPGSPDSNDEKLIDVPTLFASSTADPFRSVLYPPPPKVNTTKPVRRSAPIIRPVDPDLVHSLPDPMPGSLHPNTPPPSAPVQEKSTDLVLKGVLAGGTNGVAIVSANGSQSVVKVGDILEGGFRVASIADDQIGVVKGGKKRILSLAP